MALYRWLTVYKIYVWWNTTVIWESCLRRRHLLIKLPANGAVRDQRLSQRSVSLLRGLLIGEDCTRFQNVGWLLTVDKKQYIQARPTICNVTQLYLLLQILYMFQAVPPPITRSSKLYTQHRVFVELFLLLTAIVSELELYEYMKIFNNISSHGRKFKLDP